MALPGCSKLEQRGAARRMQTPTYMRPRFASFLLPILAFLAPACATAEEDESTESADSALTGVHVVESPPPEATSTDTYYVTFFAYQTGLNLVTRESSHTFAQFIHARPDGAGGVRIDGSDVITISWMPRSGVVRAFGPAEPGANTPFDFEIRRAATVPRARAFAWGPFRVPEVIFQRAVRQRDLLASGRVLYKASDRDPISRHTNYLDDPRIAPTFVNCLAAVGDIAPNGGTIVGASSGRGGTQEIVDHYQRWFIDGPAPSQVHDRHRWLSQRLGYGDYNALFRGQIELQEQYGRNPSGPAYSSCFCQGLPVSDGTVLCSFYGVPRGFSGGRLTALQTVQTAAYTAPGQCATRCSADWTEYGELCGTIRDTGAP